jgi:glycosyltransferase involved in cell wall biosynthesis
VKAASARARVAMLLENNPYPRDVRVRNEAESLARAGYDVTVIAPRRDGQPAREDVRGVRVRRFRLPPDRHTVAGFLIEYAVAALQLHARGALEVLRGARVIHLHNPPDILFPLAFAARALGRSVVFDHHDLAPELAASKFGERSPLVKALALCERLTMRAAQLVLSANESYRGLAMRRGRVPRDRVAVVRNGPPGRILDERGPARAGPLVDPHLVFLGELEPQDGVDALPELMRILRDVHALPAARLTVIGSGSRLSPLARALDRIGLGEQVRFTGYVSQKRVFELLAEADVCIDTAPCTPLNRRSTMTKIAEYLAAGRPVVAHDLLETRRTAGGAALLVPCDEGVAGLAERVARLARDPLLRSALESAAIGRAPALVWERSEDALLRAYSELLSGGSPSTRRASLGSGAKR